MLLCIIPSNIFASEKNLEAVIPTETRDIALNQQLTNQIKPNSDKYLRYKFTLPANGKVSVVIDINRTKDNFKIGFSTEKYGSEYQKIVPKRVKGGVVLVNTTFSIK